MRKESLIIFAISIVLTVGIVGGTHYLYLQNQKVIPDEPAVKPRAVAGAVQSRPQQNQLARRRTAKIIKCTQADGSVFWTNASRCEDADLDNSLSYYEHVKLNPQVKNSKKNKNNSNQVSRNSSDNRKSITSETPMTCRFPIGMAQKIETRSLNLKLDPSDSVWRDSYCRWVCEARRKGCDSVDDYLEMGHLCPERAFINNILCMD